MRHQGQPLLNETTRASHCLMKLLDETGPGLGL